MNTHTLNTTQEDLFTQTMLSCNIGKIFPGNEKVSIEKLAVIATIRGYEKKANAEDLDALEKIAEIDGENAWTFLKASLDSNKIDIIMSHEERQDKDMADIYSKACDAKLSILVDFSEVMVGAIKSVENNSKGNVLKVVKASAAHKSLFPLKR